MSDLRSEQSRPVGRHTPGPWSIEPFDRLDKQITILEPRVLVDFDDVDQVEAEANARLIAAAPDMLAALRETVLQWQHRADKFGETGTGAAVLARVNAAISKATEPTSGTPR